MRKRRRPRKRPYFWGAVLLAAVLAGLWLFRGPGADNVLIITLDTTRADHLSCYGYPYRTSPTLDQLAREGALFLNAQAPCSETLPSHTSLMTGLYPIHHGARYNGAQLVCEELTTLAEVLGSQGLTPAAFVSAFVLDPLFNLDQGFRVYDAKYSMARNPYFARPSERRAEDCAGAFLGWLDKEKPGKFFAWLHFFDPHQSYDPPQAYKNLFPGPHGKYDGEIAYADSQVSRVLRALKERGFLRKTLVVVTADHGEGLGDHKELSHSFFAYQSTLHVPLIMKGPGVPRGLRVESLAKVVDVFPTILDLLGLAVPGGLDGASLRPAFGGQEPPPSSPSFSEALAASAEFGWPPLYALTDNRYSYILHQKPELYRMDVDGAQNHDLSGSAVEEAARRRARVLQVLAGASPRCSPVKAKLGEAESELITGLGYIGGGRGGALEKNFVPNVDYGSQAAFVDEVIKLRSIINFDGSPSRLEDAIGGFMRLEKKYPGMPFILKGLGDAYAGLRRHGEAEAIYLRLVAMAPEAWEPRRNLAYYYERLGWTPKAVRQLREVLRLSPGDEGAWNSLGNNLLKLGDREGARRAFQKAVEINPKLAPARASLEALSSQGEGARQDG